ncbi:MAG: hypothetical protein JW839_16510 [Candidatus Lokiarchaeota archaeon]|nr:hypothetical protein [Candidatus Lokiarchaeota archaeon]
MKKSVPIIFAICTVFLVAWQFPAVVQGSYTDYLAIKPGDAYTFTYTVIPRDQSHQSILSVDLPFVINSIDDITNSSCNVTYTATYKILVDGVPKDHAQVTVRTISNSTNSTQYVYEAKSPWELFFTNNQPTNTTARTVNVPANASLDIGYGTITWTDGGVLSQAVFYTSIDGVDCTVQITQKAAGGGNVPGYSGAIILIVASIPTALLVHKVARRARRNPEPDARVDQQ